LCQETICEVLYVDAVNLGQTCSTKVGQHAEAKGCLVAANRGRLVLIAAARGCGRPREPISAVNQSHIVAEWGIGYEGVVPGHHWLVTVTCGKSGILNLKLRILAR
jgi:hypothetical protein